MALLSSSNAYFAALQQIVYINVVMFLVVQCCNMLEGVVHIQNRLRHSWCHLLHALLLDVRFQMGPAAVLAVVPDVICSARCALAGMCLAAVCCHGALFLNL